MSDSARSTDLVQVASSQGLVAMLRSAIGQADAIATGALGSEKLSLLMVPGRLVQAVRNGSFLNQLASELDQLREKGQIKPGFENSEDGQATLQELLAALETPPIDAARFNALKAIFIAAASVRGPEECQGMPQLLMSIARQMSGGEVLVLATTYAAVKTNPKIAEQFGGDDATSWLREIAARSGMLSESMVEFFEKELIEKKLVTPRHHPDGSGARFGQHFRLTDLGLKMCEFMCAGGQPAA